MTVVDMFDSYTDDKYSNLNPADDIFEHQELYDEGGHVNPEVLAEKVDILRDQVRDEGEDYEDFSGSSHDNNGNEYPDTDR